MSLRDELARALCDSGASLIGHGNFDALGHTLRERYYTQADAVIAHLALTEQIAVRWPWSQEPERNVSRESAEWRAANIHTEDGVVVRRYVTPWENT